MILYGIRNKETKKEYSRKCRYGKYYIVKGFAEKKCNDNEEIVTYELVLAFEKIKGKKYVYIIYNNDGSILRIMYYKKNTERYDDKNISLYELVEIVK